jgi:hypothetical protein
LSPTLHILSLPSGTTKKSLDGGASTLGRTHTPMSGLTVTPAHRIISFITVKAPLCVAVKSRAVREGGREMN